MWAVDVGAESDDNMGDDEAIRVELCGAMWYHRKDITCAGELCDLRENCSSIDASLP
jgi:hypothetical protein